MQGLHPFQIYLRSPCSNLSFRQAPRCWMQGDAEDSPAAAVAADAAAAVAVAVAAAVAAAAR
jgi:hypothetical protein